MGAAREWHQDQSEGRDPFKWSLLSSLEQCEQASPRAGDELKHIGDTVSR